MEYYYISRLTVDFWKVAVFFYYSGADEAVNY